MKKFIPVLLLVSFAGSSTPILAKLAYESLGPMLTMFLRSFSSVVLLIPLLSYREFFRGMNKQLVVLSVVAAANPIMLFIALEFTRASFVAPIYALSPAMTSGFLYFKGKETLRPVQILGIAIGFAGALFLSVYPVVTGVEEASLQFGNLLVLIAAVSLTAFGLLSKEYQKKHDVNQWTIVAGFSLAAWILSAPLVLYEWINGNAVDSVAFEPVHILIALSIGLFGGVVSYGGWHYLLRISSATKAGLFTYLQPGIAAILAWLVLSEPLELWAISAIFSTVVGVYLVQRQPLKTDSEQ